MLIVVDTSFSMNRINKVARVFFDYTPFGKYSAEKNMEIRTGMLTLSLISSNMNLASFFSFSSGEELL